MDFLGPYSLKDVNNNVQMEGEDLRFTLYTDVWDNSGDKATKTRIADVLLIDIDDCTMLQAKIYKLRLRKLLSDFTYSLVFSGGGLHVYLPVTRGFKKEDKKYYKRSYDKICDWLSDELKHSSIDKGVFGASKYGRVLGSTNTKYNTTVELLDVNEATKIKTLDDFLTYEDVIEIEKPTVVTYALDETPFRESPIYKNCNFIRFCDTEAARLDHETWSDAINILKASGHDQYCHDVSEGHPEYDKDKTEQKIQSFDAFVGMSCTKVSQKNPSLCHGCKFLKVPQMSASTITGPRTTVSLHRGHFQLMKHDEGFAIDYSKLDVDSLLNHFFNLHDDKLCIAQDWIYKLDEDDVTWKPYFSANLKSYGSLTRDLESLTQHELKPTMLKKTLEYLKILIPDIKPLPETPSNLVVFKSNVFDTETKTFRARLPEDYITGVSSTDISKTEPTKWLKFLNESVSNDRDRGLIQEFFGLALSRLETYNHQYVCWLYGLSGTGKSLIQTILGDLIGQECSVYFTKDELLDNTMNISNVMAKTYLAVSELSTQNDKLSAILEKKLNVLTDSNLVIKKLYVDKQTVTNRLTTVVTSNDAPPTRSMDQGGARRIRSIEFCKVPKEVNTNLRNELLEELPSIANWAIEGLFKVLENGVTTISDDELEAIESSVQDNSSLMDFMANSLDITADSKDMIATNTLYRRYESYCDAHGLGIELTSSQLSRDMANVIQRKVQRPKATLRHRDSKARYLKFLQWKGR